MVRSEGGRIGCYIEQLRRIVENAGLWEYFARGEFVLCDFSLPLDKNHVDECVLVDISYSYCDICIFR